jgi:hypothetical protein
LYISARNDEVLITVTELELVNRTDIPAFWNSVSDALWHLYEVALASNKQVESGIAKETSLASERGVETVKSTLSGSGEVWVYLVGVFKRNRGFCGVFYNCGVETNT